MTRAEAFKAMEDGHSVYHPHWYAQMRMNEQRQIVWIDGSVVSFGVENLPPDRWYLSQDDYLNAHPEVLE